MLRADLPQMTESAKWLGYFVGYEERSWDFGFGADGEGLLLVKKGKDRMVHDAFKVQPLIQQKREGRWTFRSAEEWTSEDPKGVNPKKPVTVRLKAKEGTEADFMMTVHGGKLILKPKFVDKKVADEVRMGVQISVGDFYRVAEKMSKNAEFEEKDLKKLTKADYFKAKRFGDDERINFKMFELEEDAKLDTDTGFLARGASEVEFKVGHLKKTIGLKTGNPKLSKILLEKKRGPLVKGYRLLWVVDPDNAGKKGAHLEISLK